MWSKLVDYENNTPQFYIHKFLNTIQEGDIPLAMRQAGVTTSKFLTSQDYKQYMQDILGADFSQLKVIHESENNGQLAYAISGHNSNKVCLALTKNAEKKEFGVDAYTIKQTLPLKSIKITAPAQIKIKVNDASLTEQDKEKSIGNIPEFQTMNDPSLIPQLVTYKVSDFLYEPKICIEGLTPQDFVLSKKDDHITITLSPKSDMKKQVEDFALQVSKAYANYVSKDAAFSDYAKYLLKETSYYNSIRSFDNSWYISHDSVLMVNETVSNTTMYSDTSFSTIVSFDYIVSKERMKKTYATKYKISMIRKGNTFQVVNLESL